MATAFTISPTLRVKRSSQSRNITMTPAWQTVYANSQAYAWMFLAGEINLSNMIALDHIDIRISKRDIAGGAYIVKDLFDYDDAQPVNHQKITIGPVMDTNGVLIEMRQTAGALITCYCEFFDAIR